jgi:hypothetical protein
MDLCLESSGPLVSAPDHLRTERGTAGSLIDAVLFMPVGGMTGQVGTTFGRGGGSR